jgi:hypothetical protein
VWIDELTAATVTLHARGPEGPQSWSIDIGPAEVVDGAMVGRLAARSRIREVEEGQGSPVERGSRQRDRVQARAASEIVRLAMEYGLASRETSWVAIEKRDIPVTDEAVLRRVPIAITNGWSAGWADMLSGPPPTAMGNGAVEFTLSRPILGSPDMARSFAGSWLGRVWRSRSQSTDTRTFGMRSATASRAMDRLVALQRADGYWDLDEPLAAILGLPLKDLVGRLPGTSKPDDEIRRAWATALALSFLSRQASSSGAEWDMLAAKAGRWLGSVKGCAS